MIRTVDITMDPPMLIGTRDDVTLSEFVKMANRQGWETEQAADYAPYWFIITKGELRVRVEKV